MVRRTTANGPAFAYLCQSVAETQQTVSGGFEGLSHVVDKVANVFEPDLKPNNRWSIPAIYAATTTRIGREGEAFEAAPAIAYAEMTKGIDELVGIA